jgi:hypothetical protein
VTVTMTLRLLIIVSDNCLLVDLTVLYLFVVGNIQLSLERFDVLASFLTVMLAVRTIH